MISTPPKGNNGARVAWIDCVRTLAALSVVMVHTPLNTEYDYADVLFLMAHVPVFYCLSGYLTKLASGWRQTLRRVVFLAIPYLLWNAVAYWIQGPSAGAHGAWEHLRAICLTCPNMPTWFLRNLMAYMVLAPLFRSRKWAMVIAVLLFAVVFFDLQPSVIPAHWHLPAGAAFFLMGIALQGIRLDAIRAFFLKTWPIWLGLGAIGSVLMALYHFESSLDSAPSLIGCMEILALSVVLAETRVGHGLARCGEATFLLFVIHYPVILLCGWRDSLFLPGWNYGYTVLVALGCLLLSVGILALLKRWFPQALPYVAALKCPVVREPSDSETSRRTQAAAPAGASVSKGRG